MAKKLEILIPHYHEKAADILPLLDSIALQQNVDFDDIGVIICHDGKEPRIVAAEKREPEADESVSFIFCDDAAVGGEYAIFREYPFEIKQIHQEHKGVSAARNACLDASSADYVMFCDADDMFMNVCGLWIVFREMDIGFDSLISAFTEETRDPSSGQVVYVNHDQDSTFVHGKIHRRKYLIDQGIRFNDNLTIHEDSYFNILAQNLSQNVKYCQTPFYLWKWRDESVCRHDPKYILKTYRNMLDSNDSLVDEFIRRGAQDRALFYIGFMVMDAYYTMNKPEWIDQENKEYRDSTERRFAEYYLKHKKMWDSIQPGDRMAISNSVRSRSVMEGMQMETMTIEAWLRHIKKLAGKKKTA